MAKVPCPNKSENEQTCPCGAKDCDNPGVCCECLRNHLGNGSLPACVREAGAKIVK